MPREACEFCRRARARHKTRKKTGLSWYAQRRNNCLNYNRKQQIGKHQQKKIIPNNNNDDRNGVDNSDKQEGSGINHAMKGLLELFEKEGGIEDVSSDNDASFVPESIDNNLAKSCVPPTLVHASERKALNQVVSSGVCKPSLVHFKIAESTLQRCGNLLQSIPTDL